MKMKKSFILWLLVISYWLLTTLLFAETLNSGLEKYRQGNLEEALIDFETVVNSEKESPKAKELAKEYLMNCILELGNKYLQIQDYQKALTYLEKGVTLFPENTAIKNLYQTVKEKPAVPPQAAALPPVVPARKEGVTPPVIKEITPTVPQAAPQPAIEKVALPKKEEKKQPKGVITPKATLMITEVALPTPKKEIITSKVEIKKPTTLEISEERLKLLEEKITSLSQNYEQERKELFRKLEEKDIIIKRTIRYIFLVFLFLVVLSYYSMRKMFLRGTLAKISAVSGETVSSPVTGETEKIFFNWLNSLENKQIVQIIAVLLNSKEGNVRTKGFEFLEKIMKMKKFTTDEQWKMERTLKRIGLEEGWISK